MRKNNMRSSNEKEKIVKELLSGKYSWKELTAKYNLSKSVLFRWKNQYLENGLNGLESKTGKGISSGLYLRKPKNKIEELEIEIMKKDIEIARLKKVTM